uniref:Uncharacterized protein n=1 Tax=Ixodes ricinus TaxID=34613 RepID=A0A147BFT9_IXORI
MPFLLSLSVVFIRIICYIVAFFTAEVSACLLPVCVFFMSQADLKFTRGLFSPLPALSHWSRGREDDEAYFLSLQAAGARSEPERSLGAQRRPVSSALQCCLAFCLVTFILINCYIVAFFTAQVSACLLPVCVFFMSQADLHFTRGLSLRSPFFHAHKL